MRANRRCARREQSRARALPWGVRAHPHHYQPAKSWLTLALQVHQNDPASLGDVRHRYLDQRAAMKGAVRSAFDLD